MRRGHRFASPSTSPAAAARRCGGHESARTRAVVAAEGARPGTDLGPQECSAIEIVTVGGAELAAELNDETRFCKEVGLFLLPLREVVGDALFTAENDEPNWQLAHDILAPAFTREAMQRLPRDHARGRQGAAGPLGRGGRPRRKRRRQRRHDAIDVGDDRAHGIRLPVRVLRPRPAASLRHRHDTDAAVRQPIDRRTTGTGPPGRGGLEPASTGRTSR